MRQTSLLAVLATLAIPLRLPAQHPELVVPGPGFTREGRLFTHVEIERPTLVILLPLTLSDTGTARLTSQLNAADSLTRSLATLAQQHGYVFEIRAAAWAAIHDRRANAHYAASQTEPWPALVIVRPGSRPRLVRYWPAPAQLVPELEDYATVFRPLVPL